MSETTTDAPVEIRFSGIAASPGVAIGPIVILCGDEFIVPRRKLVPDQVAGEILRLEEALVKTRQQILDMKEKLSESIGEKDAEIFDAHLMVLEDPTILGAVRSRIDEELLSIDYIYQQVVKSLVEQFRALEDEFLRERATDVHDVGMRVLRNLLGQRGASHQFDASSIVLAHDLTPSDTAQFNRKMVMGFATEIGSRTSHTAIMARSLNIPAVVGLHDILDKIESGTEVLIDGFEGLLIVNPCDHTKYLYGQIEVHRHEVDVKLEHLRETQAITTDQRYVTISANIELPEDLPLVSENGAEGIGLYRTEFLFINRDAFPTEEEQVQVYRQVAAAAKPHSVIIRTLDIGGDKMPMYFEPDRESNPFLGWRGIRFCLGKEDVFRTQLRAICRASVEGNVRVMFPMIAELGEVRRARAILRDVREGLQREGVPMADRIECGIMIEVPSAAMTADILAKEVDFFSIGTNDLIQYTLAVDRINERVAPLYQPTHPAILRLIHGVVEAAHANHIWVGVCGEMAGDILLAPMLVGLGVDELSLGSVFVPRIKKVIQTLHYGEAQQMAQKLMNYSSAEDVLQALTDLARRLFPELL